MHSSTRLRRWGAMVVLCALTGSVLAVGAASPAGAVFTTTGELAGGDATINPTLDGTGTCGGAASIFSGGDHPYDVHPFFVTADGPVTIDLRGTATGGGTLSDPYLMVYCDVFDPSTPQANIIAGNDDAGVGFDSQLVLTLQAGVQYYALASNFSAAQLGTYTLDLGGAAQAGFVAQVDRAAVTVAATGATAPEGGDPGSVTFTRVGDRFSTLLVRYSVSGTATSGDDFEELSGVAQFPYGEQSVVVPVQALADDVADADETVVVTVEFGEYDRREPRSATVTITEPAPPAAPACAAVPDAGYTDVPEGYEHADNIDCITAYGLAEGYPDGTYRFSQPVKRMQMASFVARLLDAAGVALSASPPDAFPGDDGDVHELAINQLAALDIFDGTTGEQGDTYGVSDEMRRDDMAQILVNAYKVITGEDLSAGEDAFTDDDDATDPDGTGTDNEDAINALAAAGVVQGTGGGLYDPDGSVTRGQFASFFARYLQVLVDAGVTVERP